MTASSALMVQNPVKRLKAVRPENLFEISSLHCNKTKVLTYNFFSFFTSSKRADITSVAFPCRKISVYSPV